MKKKLIFCVCLMLCVILCASTIPFSAFSYDCPVESTSRAVLVANLNTDTFVYEKNSSGVRYQSYLTNIMTFIVARNNVADIEEKVEIKKSVLDAIAEPDNSLDKYVGKTLTVKDLLYCIMLTNGKDASFVLADYVSKGKVDDFVALMNKKARDLGCKKTKFTSPAAVFDKTQYTTCKDLYKIVKCALDTPDYKEISGAVEYTISTKKMLDKTITTNNSLLKKKSPYYFTYAENGKYGVDKVARGNLVSVANYNNLDYVCITLGSQVSSEHNAFTEAKLFFSWVYLYLGNKQIVSDSSVLKTVTATTPWGETDINLTVGEDIVRSVPDTYTADMITIKVDETLDVKLPVFEGQNMGTANLYYDGRYYETIDLISDSSVGVSMYGDITSFLGSMFDATLAPSKEQESEEQSALEETQSPTQKTDKSSKKSKDTKSSQQGE